jgi:hypothetical protein
MPGRVTFEPIDPSHSRVAFDVDLWPATRRLRLILKLLLFAVAPLVLVVLPGVLWFVAVPNPNVGVRAQAIQIVQTVHVLWPSFLLAHLDRRIHWMVRDSLRTFIGNLPYV